MPWGAAAGGADAPGVDADDLAEVADGDELAGVVDEVDGGDLADLGGGLHVDDVVAAAGPEAVLRRCRCALPKPFSNTERMRQGVRSCFPLEPGELGVLLGLGDGPPPPRTLAVGVYLVGDIAEDGAADPLCRGRQGEDWARLNEMPASSTAASTWSWVRP